MSVVTYILQKIPIKVYNLRTLIISIALTFGLFYFLLIFSSLLHVNLVKVVPPSVINTYEDILSRIDATNGGKKLRTAWSLDFPDTEIFRQGPRGSKEREIWEKTNQISGGPYYVKLGLDMINASIDIAQQKMVVLLNKGYAFFVRNTLCDFTINDENKNFHAWISVDKSSMLNQKGYVLRESLGGKLRKFIDMRTRRISEAGLIGHVYRESRHLRVGFLSQSKRRNCSSETIVIDVNYQDDQQTQIGNAQFKALHCACAVLIMIALASLLIEIKFKRRKRNLIRTNIIRVSIEDYG